MSFLLAATARDELKIILKSNEKINDLNKKKEVYIDTLFLGQNNLNKTTKRRKK